MTIIDHAAVGGLMTFPLLFFKKTPVFWIIAAFSLFAFFGALPDALGFIGNAFYHDNWTLYGRAHHGDIASIIKYFPSYGLHLYVDTFFHTIPGAWWPRLWKEETLGAVIESIGLYFYFRELCKEK